MFILPLANVGVFTLKFRSSFFDSYPGFHIFVTCLSSAGIILLIILLSSIGIEISKLILIFLCQSPNKMQNALAMNQNLI